MDISIRFKVPNATWTRVFYCENSSFPSSATIFVIVTFLRARTYTYRPGHKCIFEGFQGACKVRSSSRSTKELTLSIFFFLTLNVVLERRERNTNNICKLRLVYSWFDCEYTHNMVRAFIHFKKSLSLPLALE